MGRVSFPHSSTAAVRKKKIIRTAEPGAARKKNHHHYHHHHHHHHHHAAVGEEVPVQRRRQHPGTTHACGAVLESRVGGSRPSVRVRRERTPCVGSCPNLSSGRWWLRVAAFALRPATRAAGATDTRGGLHMEARRGHVALAARPGVGASIISAQQHCCCAEKENHPHSSTAAVRKKKIIIIISITIIIVIIITLITRSFFWPNSRRV